ncbi:hypothetical protein XI07_15805 [Bradyrhizobium sp. CCBAU 11445]|uniref:hypothetical protein n=1 Tax=unclassified Bradyrhizobium TaxID=2631580 RepID=UPI002304DB08|nr:MULTISPECIES: hypothetical protein [unclassified Bradyrhizobium]MDA9483449.1 hypothetical protein [Bradyrhizobium sp. CCBAU 11445]MDA9523316.1 hypothetical protein [Bradyrhizobium sp. CCBAU 11434]
MMEIDEYLELSRLIHKTSSATEPVWFVDRLFASTEVYLNEKVGFRQISSSTASHQAIKAASGWFIVWDNVLARTCSDLLYGFGSRHLAHQLASATDASNANQFASSVCRRAFAAYFANRLVGHPYVSAAFAMLACEETKGADLLNEPALKFVSRINELQKMMMFFHEFSHVFFDCKPEFHARCVDTMEVLLDRVGEMQKRDEIYNKAAPVALRSSRELDPSSPVNQKRGYINELACDYQAFYLTCLEDSNGDGRLIDWKDALGMCVLASQMLGNLEANLNMGVLALLDVCRCTEGFSRIEGLDISGIQARMKAEQPRLLVRQWNTILSLQRVLNDVGKSMGLDAHKHQDQILEAFSAANVTWNEAIAVDFGAFFTPEYLAKIVSRVSLLKNNRRMSKEQALEYSAKLLGWGAIPV